MTQISPERILFVPGFGAGQRQVDSVIREFGGDSIGLTPREGEADPELLAELMEDRIVITHSHGADVVDFVRNHPELETKEVAIENYAAMTGVGGLKLCIKTFGIGRDILIQSVRDAEMRRRHAIQTAYLAEELIYYPGANFGAIPRIGQYNVFNADDRTPREVTLFKQDGYNSPKVVEMIDLARAKKKSVAYLDGTHVDFIHSPAEIRAKAKLDIANRAITVVTAV